MTIPLIALLYIYLLLMVIMVVFAIIQILHIFVHAVTDKIGVSVTVFFVLGLIVIITGSFIMLGNVDWSQPLITIGATL